MSSAFGNRRKPRKIGGDDEEAGEGGEQGRYKDLVYGIQAKNGRLPITDSEPVVKRPASSKTKQKSKLRVSFGPGGTSMADDDGEPESEVIVPKRHGLGRRALERSAAQRSASSRLPDQLPVRVGMEQEGPSYSQEYLKELRDSTPSTPKTATDEEEKGKEVDVAAKFGEVMKVSATSAIPSEVEIREKKARRARLAKEQDYIGLDPAEDEEWSLKPGEEAAKDTRLIRDDEDFAEGFDDFVEDGRISLGRKAEREQKRKQREEMRELIDDAEGLSDEEDSDEDEKAAYEVTQTRAAMGNGGHIDRPRTPPKITSIPRLASSLERLRTMLADKEHSKQQMISRMEELRKEKADIATREVEIQTLIKEAGENYERLKQEAGATPGSEGATPASDGMIERGLENIGAPMVTSNPHSEEEP